MPSWQAPSSERAQHSLCVSGSQSREGTLLDILMPNECDSNLAGRPRETKALQDASYLTQVCRSVLNALMSSK